MAICFIFSGINILYWLCCMFSFKKPPNCWVVFFFTVDVPASILTHNTFQSSFSTFLLAFGALIVCFSSHSGKYVVISHCDFNLYAAKMLTFLCALFVMCASCYIFGKIPFTSFFPFSKSIFNFFLFTFQVS